MIDGTMNADEVAFARGLARHVVSSVWTSGDGVTRVREVADDSLNFSDVVGRFTTGEVAFALARMERLFPGEGWGDRIPDIVDYLVRRKAVEEGFVPDMADHWAAYAFAETTKWSEPLRFDEVARSWARKQMGISSVMIRYESQLTNGFPDRALRGATALGAAVGTHGEAMAGWTTYFAATRGVDDDVVSAGVARLACNIGTLTARQIDSDEAASYAQPSRVEGAWLSGGVTQIDDQQHAMSAVLAGDRVSGDSIDPRPSRRQPLDWSWVLVLVAAVAVAAPSRVATALVRSPGSMRRDVVVAGVAALVLALFSVPILEAVDVSVPTAAVACGVVVVLASLAAFLGVWRDERSFMVVARPELLLLVLAVGAGSRTWPLIAGLLFAYGLAEWLARFDDNVRVWATRMESLLAIAVGVALVVNGVYSI
jgi:small neutral amino acid transporter SnatA (MarC family)